MDNNFSSSFHEIIKFFESSNILSWLLVITPILDVYIFVGPITIGEAVLSLCAFIYLFCSSKPLKIKVDKSLLIIVVYFFIVTILGVIWFNTELFKSIKEYFAFFIYFAIIFIINNKVNISAILDKYKKVAITMSVFIIFQFFSFQLFHFRIPGLIPNITTIYGVNSTIINNNQNGRALGFFNEPAMTARYLGIPFIFVLLELTRKKKLFNKEFLVLLLGLLFTLSGNAIVTIIIGLIIVVLNSIIANGFRNVIYLSVALLFFISGFSLLNHTVIFSKLFNRASEISGNSNNRSGYIRIVRGYLAYYNLPSYSKLIGIGFGNYETVIDKYIYNTFTKEFSVILTWLNGIQVYFIYGGAIGGILFLNFLRTQFVYGSLTQKYYLVLFISYLFIAAINCSPQWLIFMLIILDRKTIDYKNSNNNSYLIFA